MPYPWTLYRAGCLKCEEGFLGQDRVEVLYLLALGKQCRLIFFFFLKMTSQSLSYANMHYEYKKGKVYRMKCFSNSI